MAAVKAFRIVLLVLIGGLLLGNAYHLAKFRSLGLFEWSSQINPETGSREITRTAALPPSETIDPDETQPLEIAASDAASTTAAATEAKPSAEEASETPEASPAPPEDPNRFVLFDGESLGNWESIEFGGEGDVVVDPEAKAIEVDFGAIMTGVKWTEEPPATSNFEIEFEARKLDGNDFFCALTFPVKKSHATFVIGGWGGGIVGISSVDDLDASENETMNVEGFENGVWYRIKVRVTDDRIDAWIDQRHMVDLELEDKKISLRPGDIELCVPVGIAAFMTRAQYRDIQWRNLTPEEAKQPGKAPEKKEAE